MLNKINLAQVFLWFQEKELMGEASLLFDPHPGVDFSAIDLVRNLLLSGYMENTLEEQEQVLKDLWLDPLEIPHKADKLKKILASFIEEIVKSQGSGRHVGLFEKCILQSKSPKDLR